jgi:hydrogenase nickel incorporation protein HypA/HybF
MHEFVYADRILQTVLSDASKIGRRPVYVEVEVGELLGLTRESLTTAYGILAKGTVAEDSKLRMKLSRGFVECASCGYRGRLRVGSHEHVVDPAFACPQCGAPVNISAGMEVTLKQIQWEEGLHPRA